MVEELPLEIALSPDTAFVIWGPGTVFYEGTDPMKLINVCEIIQKLDKMEFAPKEMVHFIAIHNEDVIWSTAITVDEQVFFREIKHIVASVEASGWDKGPVVVENVMEKMLKRWQNEG
jgi:hypothetical protein